MSRSGGPSFLAGISFKAFRLNLIVFMPTIVNVNPPRPNTEFESQKSDLVKIKPPT